MTNAQTEWIPVAQELPPEGEIVLTLIRDDDREWCARYLKHLGGRWLSTHDEPPIRKPTHWARRKIMGKLYQIEEEDLASLEAELPRLLEGSMMACNDPLTRKRWQEVKAILSNVRWNYGPPQEVHEIPASD